MMEEDILVEISEDVDYLDTETAQEDVLRLRTALIDARRQLTEAQALAARAIEALREIAEHPHQDYYHPTTGTSPYGTGVVDGHRCAGNVARAILSSPSAEAAGKWLEEQKAEAAREHLRFLYDWHSVQETEADAVGALESCEYHQQRRAIFKETLNEFEKAVAKQREWKEAPND